MPDKEDAALVLRRCKLLFLLRRLDACGKELDEFGAVGAEIVEGR